MTPVNPEVSTPQAAPRRKFKWGWIIVIVVAVILVWGCINLYNKFVTLEKQVDERWSNVEASMQERGDLVGNLVAVVKRYAEHEETVFIGVAEARSKLNNAATPEELAAANGELSSALSRLMVVVESYPEVKADQNFLGLQAQLEGLEHRIKYSRTQYNEIVREYNTAIKRFPAVLLSGLFGFDEREFFEGGEKAMQVPDVGAEFDK